MTTARKQLVSVESTPYYHCVSRCVRRSFLCGTDPHTKQSYQHRRDWIENKIYSLAKSYCIDICAYAIMSNHYHLVVHINKNKALTLSDREVVERWMQNHKLPFLVQRWFSEQPLSKAETQMCLSIIEKWRNRLWSLSWFMKELNFDIALKANQEDQCTGHFWESRFKSQALLDEKALAAAMVYVDLNPVRAGISTQPEQSQYTSIKARFRALKEQKQTAPLLFPFIGNVSNKEYVQGIPLRLQDYLELVDSTAKQYRAEKATLSADSLSILQKLTISQQSWFNVCTYMERRRVSAIGDISRLEHAKRYLHKSRIHLFKLDG